MAESSNISPYKLPETGAPKRSKEVKQPRKPKKPKLYLWPGVPVIDQIYDVPETRPMPTYNPFKMPFVRTAAYNIFGWSAKRISREFEFADEVKKTTKCWNQTMINFEQKAGKSPEGIMHYMSWYDGWNYLSFPKLICDLAYNDGKDPRDIIITWMPSFKRTAVDVKEDGNGEVEGMEKMYFLDEMNNLLEDRGSELYRYAVQYAKDAQKWSEEHGNHRVYLRPFHEMNLGYGYNWTGFLNGGPEGVAKFNRAWKNVRDIFQKHAPNVKFVLCFESSPDVETTPELAEDWNQFEEYMPDYWVNGDIIGFDVYQKKAGLSWKHIFGKAEAFLKKYSDLPAAICEASTYDGSYRVKFIDNLFKSAQKLGLDYVVWFNEKKKESGLDRNFRYDANIIEVKTVAAQPVMTVGGDEDLMDLEGGEEEPMPAPKEVAEAEPAMTSTTPNVGLKAFREAIAKYTAGDNHGFALNPKGYIQQYWTKDGIGYETEDDIYYMTEFENEAVTDSFMKALLRMRYEKKTAEQTKAISRFPTLKSLTLLPDVNEARVEVAISHFEKWLARPKKMSTKKTGRTDFDLG
ncbi:hypothetical protein ACFLZ2_01860, partial [Candidatus Margulisiibacteriota bacterium]